MDENQIPTIIQRTACVRHAAPRGVPCWKVWPMSGRRSTPAVCNRRAIFSGFNGEIDPRSLRRGNV